MQHILGQGNDKKLMNNEKKKEERSRRRWTFQRKDPNAMDIDAMTTKQRDEAMKKGLCFGCGKQGHLSSGLPDEEKTHNEFYSPELCLNVGTSVDKYSEKEDEQKRVVHSHLKPYGTNG